VSFASLALVCAIALAGPLLAWPRRWHLPVLLGELAAGAVLGTSVIGVLDADEPTFAFLADIGFALVMFVAGTHVPIRDRRLGASAGVAAARAAGVGVLAVPVAWAISSVFQTGHTALYAVLLASSSAALVLPTIDTLRLRTPSLLPLLAQVAIADAACIVALPLVIDPPRAGRAAIGAAAVVAASLVLYLVLAHLERSGVRRAVHQVSEEREFAVELRVNLVILFALCALAVTTHVSILLAGFCFGLVVAAVGEPRRLARQLFAVTEGFLGPLFFVWLGASLDVTGLARHPSYILLGVALGLGAVLVHAAVAATGQPPRLAVLAATQLGVPVAAVTIGEQRQLLLPGESAAIVLGAILTIGAGVLAAAGAATRTPGRATSPGPAPSKQ